jgi:type IX secretion system PorP/SprF family membrane protein
MSTLRKFLTLGLICLSAGLFAQDIHFSQFYMSPLNLNPALTGVMNCNHRVVANYRNQWASVLKANAFSTYSVSYDQRVAIGRYDYFGFGGVFWGDRAGELDFSTLQGRLSGSYAKRMAGSRGEAHYLSIGVDAGVSQRSIDFLRAQWPEQAVGGVFNENEPSNEPIGLDDNFMFFDMSAGLLWFSVWGDNQSFYIGGAYSHLNRANMTFYRGDPDATPDVPLYSKFTIHTGGEFMLGDNFGILPGAVMFLQGPSTQINGGFSLKFLLGNQRFSEQSFQIGTWARVANRFDEGSMLVDALILSTRFDYDLFGIGFSYDLNVSTLRPATNNNGAFEFSVNYKICGPERRGVYCPNF